MMLFNKCSAWTRTAGTRKLMMILLCVVLTAIFASFASAQCVNPSDNLDISSDTTLCSGTFNIVDTAGDGVVRITAGSVSLTCNNTIIIGDDTGSGFYSVNQHQVNISGCEAVNYSTGFSLEGDFCSFHNLTSRNNVKQGFDYQNSIQSNFSLIRSYSNTGNGFNILTATDTVIEDSDIYNNGDTGIYLQGSSDSLIENVLFEDNDWGIQFTLNSNDNIVKNSTFENSTSYHVFLANPSSGNTFYFNQFRSATLGLANDQSALNLWSVDNGSACGALCQRGNLWDDIGSLDIVDSNIDGYGDSGTAYPYSAATGGNVVGSVSDNGPMIDYPPTGSIDIVGPNGSTVFTGSRMVFLNLTYADDFCLPACRWANDNASNLGSMSWESCVGVKAWILSEEEGNKTVFYELRDCKPQTTVMNTSITYRFTQDYTPPTAPVVYDGDTGIDIDWVNSNTTLSAYWWNATDDISNIYYKYRIFEDGSCFGGCDWTDVGERTDVTVPNLSLDEGSNYTFEVTAYIEGGFNATSSSDGVIIDLTPPTAPDITSLTHPIEGTSYGSSDVLLNFTAQDLISGIDGYSYMVGMYPGSAPDDNVEARDWQVVRPMIRGTYNTTIRDDMGGSAYAVFSQVHTNLSVNDTVRIRVVVAERDSDLTDLMSLRIYLATTGEGMPISGFDITANAVSDIIDVSRDFVYSYDMSLSRIYQFDVTVNESIDDSFADVYVVVAGMPSDDDNRNPLDVGGTDTLAFVDNTTASFVCDEVGACVENTYSVEYSVEARHMDSGDVWDVDFDLPDGNHYFHVKAKDMAGNWGDPSHYNIVIDTAAVSARITSPFTGQLFNSPNIPVVVDVDQLANVSVTVVNEDGDLSTSALQLFNGDGTFDVVLDNGTNEIYATAVNPANDVISYSQSVFVRMGVGLPESNKTIRVSYGNAGILTNHIRGVDEGDIVVGIATENNAAAFNTGSIESDTSIVTIKLFATTDLMDQSGVEDDLDDDDFLDRVNPAFGIERGVAYYIIRTELRPANIYLEGDKRFSAGAYSLVFRNTGFTADGRVNISVRSLS
ncbi:right-handed parallel beta-helix repeat-containing protein [Candidatus Woesearchaeota archaeon]|nr:right-handed parallel beta-helix repeat-containing protein [Candidatus Woesearchaeota archaeon]